MYTPIPLPDYRRYTLDEMTTRAREFRELVHRRRTVREYSSRDVPQAIIEECIAAAGSAPSGANMQPWHFVAIHDTEIKHRIREAAEKEERAFYQQRASQQWLDALAPLGTDANKVFLDTAPWLIAVFGQKYSLNDRGERVKHYYTPESVGLACGILITALHHAGLATLTHTPSPMGFLRQVLGRPTHERPFLLVVAGYPAADAQVPDIKRKTFDQIATILA